MNRLTSVILSCCVIFGSFNAYGFSEPATSEAARILMLENALAPKSAEETAKLFAEANKNRNGAVQFMLFSDLLKQQYKDAWPTWVSGVSSPWITSYEITKSPKQDNIFIIKYNQATSSGPFEPMVQTITIESDARGANVPKHYRITELK